MTDPRDSGRVLDRDLAPVASLIGDPTRIAILAALAEGHALPAGELAHRAGVHPATATAHLRQLVDGGLVSVRVQGTPLPRAGRARGGSRRRSPGAAGTGHTRAVIAQ